MANILLGITAVIGILVTLISLFFAVTIQTENIMQQIYVALQSQHALLGLLIFAVSIGTGAIGDEIRKAHRAAAADRQTITAVLRRLAEQPARVSSAEIAPMPTVQASTAPGGWPRNRP